MTDDRECERCGCEESEKHELKPYPGKEGLYCLTCRDWFDDIENGGRDKR